MVLLKAILGEDKEQRHWEHALEKKSFQKLELSLAHTKTQRHHKSNIQGEVRLQVNWGKTLAERTSDKPQLEKSSHNLILKKNSHKVKQGIRTVDVILCQTPFPDTSTMWLLSTCYLDVTEVSRVRHVCYWYLPVLCNFTECYIYDENFPLGTKPLLKNNVVCTWTVF